MNRYHLHNYYYYHHLYHHPGFIYSWLI